MRTRICTRSEVCNVSAEITIRRIKWWLIQGRVGFTSNAHGFHIKSKLQIANDTWHCLWQATPSKQHKARNIAMNHISKSVQSNSLTVLLVTGHSESVTAIGESAEDIRKRHIQLVQTLMLHMCMQDLQIVVVRSCAYIHYDWRLDCIHVSNQIFGMRMSM